MRKVIVIALALVAVLAAGVWSVGQFGGALTGGVGEARAPLVREPELVAASTPTKPAATNSQPSLRTVPASPTTPAAKEPAVNPTPAPTEPATPPNPLKPNSLNPNGPGVALPQLLPEKPATPPATTEPATQPQTDPVVKPQGVPPSTPAAAAVTASDSSLASQFKLRRLTYNRPPEKLALDKPIDIALIIDTAGNANAEEKLKNLPGTVVDRDVELSDFVAAELSGADFTIEKQTAAEKQKLSPKFGNQWRWRVTPTAKGKHTLTLVVYGYATGSDEAEPLDSYVDEITVEVQQFDELVTWARGVQPIFAVLAAFAAVGSATFAFLRFREEKKQTQVMSSSRSSGDDPKKG